MTHSSPSVPVIAAFDFDHTLIDRDSLFRFLIYVQGFWKTIYKLFMLTPYFLGFLLKLTARQTVKEKILQVFFKDVSFIELQQLANKYAENQLDLFLKPDGLKCLKWHQQQGHRCILISASLELYLIPWAKRHGFQDVIASRLEVNSVGNVTGYLVGKNCWGVEKTRRLVEVMGSKERYLLYAYGDSQGDQELLEMADYPFYQRFNY